MTIWFTNIESLSGKPIIDLYRNENLPRDRDNNVIIIKVKLIYSVKQDTNYWEITGKKESVFQMASKEKLLCIKHDRGK